MADKKMPLLKELLQEGLVVCPTAIEGTNPFGTRKPDNFTFKGLPGRIIEDQKAKLTKEQQTIQEDKFKEAFKSLIEASGINAEKMFNLLIEIDGMDTREAANVAEALESAVLKQVK